MHDARTIEGIRRKFLALSPVMDERIRRQWAATEAKSPNGGGTTAVAEATGLAWNTIKAGMRKLDCRAARPQEPVSDRVRRCGAGLTTPKVVNVNRSVGHWRTSRQWHPALL